MSKMTKDDIAISRLVAIKDTYKLSKKELDAVKTTIKLIESITERK